MTSQSLHQHLKGLFRRGLFLFSIGLFFSEARSGGIISHNANELGIYQIQLLASGNAIAENGGYSVIKATLSKPISEGMTINIRVLAGSKAIEGRDFILSTKRLFIGPGDLSDSITVSALNDDLVEDDELFILELSEVNGMAVNDGQQLSFSIIDDDHLPEIDSPNSLSVPENTTFIQNIEATDRDPSTQVEYGIAGGVDNFLFEVNRFTGGLSFINEPDFEHPEDHNGDNVYQLIIVVSDGTNSKTQHLTVIVTDVDEVAPVVTSAIKESDSLIVLTFSESIRVNDALSTDFLIHDINQVAFEVYSVMVDSATDSNLILSTSDLTSAQSQLIIAYQAIEEGVTDLSGNNLVSNMSLISIMINTPPVVSHVGFSGDLVIGDTLKGVYHYDDFDHDEETGTEYHWYRSQDSLGTDKVQISEAKSLFYVLNVNDLGQYLSFGIRPSDGIDKGSESKSQFLGPVGKRQQSIYFPPLSDKIYGDSSVNLEAISSSGLDVSYKSSNTEVAVIEENKLIIKGAGKTDIIAWQTGDSLYAEANAIVRSLKVGKAPLTAKADDKQRIKGEQNPELTISYQGFRNQDNVSELDVLPNITTNASNESEEGVYTIKLSGGSDNNYSLNLVNGVFKVVERPKVMSVLLPGAGSYGLADSLYFKLRFKSPVFFRGSPALGLSLSTSEEQAHFLYVSDDGTEATFFYVVKQGDLSPDGILLDEKIILNGARIVGAFGVDVDAVLQNVPSSKDILIDGIAPVPVVISSTPQFINHAFDINIAFDEPVIDFGPEGVAVTNGIIKSFTNVKENQEWTMVVVPSHTGEISISVNDSTVVDSAGNANRASTNICKVFYDRTPPEVESIKRAVEERIPSWTSSVDFSVQFNENVYDVELTDFEVITTGTVNARVDTFKVIDARRYIISVGDIQGEGTIGLSVRENTNMRDVAGNHLMSRAKGEIYTTNFSPSDILLSASSIKENNKVGDVIAELRTIDSDQEDNFIYTLISKLGDSKSSSSFLIRGNHLIAAREFDFEDKPTYHISISTDDGYGGFFEKTFIIQIVDEPEALLAVSGETVLGQTQIGKTERKNWYITNNGDTATEVKFNQSSSVFNIEPGVVTILAGETVSVKLSFIPAVVGSYYEWVALDYQVTRSRTDNLLIALSGIGVEPLNSMVKKISGQKISIYPNPTKDFVNIDLNQIDVGLLNVSLIDPLGIRRFHKTGYSESFLNLELTQYEPGVYIVYFSNEVSMVRKKIIIEK